MFEILKDFAQGMALGLRRRYASALSHAGNPERFAGELQRAGYATDPDYAAKIRAIVDTLSERTF